MTEEKGTAAICRKVHTKDGSEIEIWGRKQTRSFYILTNVRRRTEINASDFIGPVNIGSEKCYNKPAC